MPVTPPPDGFSPALWPSGTLWLPCAPLVSCVRAVLERNTVGTALTDEQRINRFPASPLCSLSWWFAGRSLRLVPEADGLQPPSLDSVREPMPGAWVLAGPQTRPSATWCPGPAHGLMVLLFPDALRALTGLEPEHLTDRLVDASQHLPTDWGALRDAVQHAPTDAERLQRLEDFLRPRWAQQHPTPGWGPMRYGDWAVHLAQRAAVSGPGRSLRQLERRIKRWSGLPLRELRGFGRAEQAFFDAALAAQAPDGVHWASVATDAGFSDQSHLCRVTRRMTGFSPMALHQGITQEEPFWAYRLWA